MAAGLTHGSDHLSPPTPAAAAEPAPPTPRKRAATALRQIAASGRPEVWTHLIDEELVMAQASAVERRLAAGEQLPLAGLTVAVKDNIDVAGVPTTAACPAFAYTPAVDAPCVAALRVAGAVVVGKANMDQFATGLVGTRSPAFGVVRDAARPEYVSGGSSSGSAVAVALGLCDLALGTDTAGSGRIPAAFQGIVGYKPSRGLISTEGVVPACRSFDCISVFAATVSRAETAVNAIADPNFVKYGPTPRPDCTKFGVFDLPELSDPYRRAFEAAVDRAEADGAQIVEIDPAPFIDAGELLYAGAFVAERYAAVGAFIEAAEPSEIDPTVRQLILDAKHITAADYVRDTDRLQRLRQQAHAELAGLDALLLPTAPFQPTIAQVHADPIAVNRRLGAYTTFANLLDLCAISIPAGHTPDGGHFGVTLYATHGHDAHLVTLAKRYTNEPEPQPPTTPDVVELLVVGAHLRGQPLNGQLTERDARFIADAQTAPGYRLYALQTEPPKPGLVRDRSTEASIGGELWAIPPHGLGTLLAALPAPMALGPVNLIDGRTVVGFLCEPAALEGATEITGYGGWRGYLS
jgi:allophanate hydrolase